MRKLVVTLGLGLWACWTSHALASTPLFVPALNSPLPVGRGSGQVLLADINNDGHLDLLAQHLLTRKISLQLGDGKGGFAPAPGSPMSFDFQPGGITLGDVNHDKNLDLAVPSRDEGKGKEFVHILLGNGHGGFTEATGSPFTASAAKETYKPTLRLLDVNEDGHLDIATSNGRRNTFEILLGDGKGGFGEASVLKLEAAPPRFSSALADLDRDGHLDLAIVTSFETSQVPGSITVKRGDGKGFFTDDKVPPLSVPQAGRVGTVGDVNDDGQLDLVLTHASNLVSVLTNQGNGRLSVGSMLRLKPKNQGWGVVVADVNQDQKADLVIASVDSLKAPFESSIEVFLGDGKHIGPAPGGTFRAGPGAYNLAVGDINEDGRVDVAASSFEGDAVTLLLGK